MHGQMLRAVSSKRSNIIKQIREAWKNESNQNADTVGALTDAFAFERGRTDFDSDTFGDGSGENGNDGVSLEQSRGNTRRDYDSSGADYQIDLAEVDRIIRELRKMIAELDEEPKGRVNRSRNVTGEVVRYNKKDLYTVTDEYARKVVYEDRGDFNRWLANKTFDLADGEFRNILIYCGKRIYCFRADGYMRGTMLQSIDPKNADAVRKARKDFENGIESSGETFDSWSSVLSLEREGKGGDFSFLAEQRGEDGANGLPARTQERNSAGDRARGGRDYQIDLAEVDRIIRELRKIIAELDEEPKGRVNRSRSITGEVVTISRGEMAKLHANYAGDKVFIKKDVDAAIQTIDATGKIHLANREEDEEKGKVRRLANPKSVDNDTSEGYDDKYIDVSTDEYAIIGSCVMNNNAPYIANGEPLPKHGSARTANFYYVYENIAHDSFGVVEQVAIVGNESLSQQIDEKIGAEDGKAIVRSAKDVDRVLEILENISGFDSNNHIVNPRGVSNSANGEVDASESRSDGERYSRKSRADQKATLTINGETLNPISHIYTDDVALNRRKVLCYGKNIYRVENARKDTALYYPAAEASSLAQKRKDYKNGLDNDTETSDLWADLVSFKRGGSGNDIFTDDHTGRTGENDSIFDSSRAGNGTRNSQRSSANHQIDFKEVDQLIQRLREMLARLDAEPSTISGLSSCPKNIRA